MNDFCIVLATRLVHWNMLPCADMAGVVCRHQNHGIV